MRFLLYLLACILSTGFAAVSANGQQNCLSQARDDYEKLYCRIKAGGEGAHLPSLADFRRNPPGTQALLLRRPAARLGLSLPKAKPTSQSDTSSNNGRSADGLSASLPAHEPKPQPAQKPERSDHDIANCTLARERLSCGPRRFDLVSNRSNHLLAKDVLAESNRLIVPKPPVDESAEKAYLIDAYQIYIEKMLEIGLGASTMTFSKFYYTYQAIKRQNVGFPARMAAMFDYLKRDKATLSIKPRYHDQLPSNLEQCSYLGPRLIVCDEGELNWVFRSRKP